MDEGGYYEKNYILQYSEFDGSPTDDVEFFLRDFEAIARYNEQSSDEEKLRILPDLLMKQALTWYKSLPAEHTQDWKHFRAALMENFRRNPHKLLTKLSRIKKKPEETIRKYSNRVTKLINKLQLADEPYPERVKVWWYLKGLPTSLRTYCLQGDYATLEASISTAKVYESTALTPREELHGRAREGEDDSDLDVDHSDVESSTSMGTFMSSVAESVDLKAKKISPRKAFSSPGLPKGVHYPWDKKIGTYKDRPLTGVIKPGEKLSKKTNLPMVDFKHGNRPERPQLSPTRKKCDAERLPTTNLKKPLPGHRKS